MIDGVTLTPLRQIFDDRGAVFHMLRKDAEHFAGFGEVYFSIVNEGVVKSWRRHREMTMSLAVPVGRIRMVLCDQRDDGPTSGERMTVFLGESEQDYQLLTVPPMVWAAFQSVGEGRAIIANCASAPHSPDEVERASMDAPELRDVWDD